eukprot:scaffold17764_cov66-Phaeocystis_antarctica.AAC.2
MDGARVAAARCEFHEHPLKLLPSNRDCAPSRLAAIDPAHADDRASLNLHFAQPHGAAPPGEDGAARRRAPAIEQTHALELEHALILDQKVAGLTLCVEHGAVGAERQPLAVAHDESGAEEVRARGQVGVDGGLAGGEEGVELG